MCTRMGFLKNLVRRRLSGLGRNTREIADEIWGCWRRWPMVCGRSMDRRSFCILAGRILPSSQIRQLPSAGWCSLLLDFLMGMGGRRKKYLEEWRKSGVWENLQSGASKCSFALSMRRSGWWSAAYFSVVLFLRNFLRLFALSGALLCCELAGEGSSSHWWERYKNQSEAKNSFSSQKCRKFRLSILVMRAGFYCYSKNGGESSLGCLFKGKWRWWARFAAVDGDDEWGRRFLIDLQGDWGGPKPANSAELDNKLLATDIQDGVKKVN